MAGVARRKGRDDVALRGSARTTSLKTEWQACVCEETILSSAGDDLWNHAKEGSQLSGAKCEGLLEGRGKDVEVRYDTLVRSVKGQIMMWVGTGAVSRGRHPC